MTYRSVISLGLLAAVIPTVALIGVPVAGQAPGATTSTFAVPKSPYTPPKLPWGDPDLQGIYENRNNVPMERPASLVGKKTFTEEEMARREGRGGRGGADCARNVQSEACQAAAVAQLENVGGYNRFWGETHGGVSDNRTALIEDPADGKTPPLTPGARAIQEAYLRERGPIALDTGVEDRYGRLTTYKHWLDFDILGRCIAAQTPTGQIGYNAARQIVQSPGWVLITIERLNTRIIPLDGRPHLGQNIRSWQGDSRGHWEGNTLVVETTNFTNRQSGGGVGSSVGPGIPFGTIRLVEHFVPVSSKRVHYYATLEDPKTWARPWTFMQPWEKDPVVIGVDGKSSPYVMYEYACREGDEGIANSLRGTLVEAERAKRRPVEATVATLIDATEAAVREKFGAPAATSGPRWEYQTTITGTLLNVYFVGGKVASVRPDDLPLDQVVKTR